MPTKTIDDKVTITITLISIAIAIYPQITWIIAFETPHGSQFEAVHNYLLFFPSFARNELTIAYAALISAILSIIFSIRWNNKVFGAKKTVPILILVLSILLVLMNLFSMM